jgi:3'(2'), 5'-bisphosphate nucleotidase
VAVAYGVHASRLDGSPLRYNNANPYLPDLLICHPGWARPALSALAGARPAQGT